MTAITDFVGLVRSLNPVMGRLFVQGRNQVLDPYDRATTLPSNGSWARDKRGWAIQHYLAQTLVADGAEQQGTSGTLFVATSPMGDREVAATSAFRLIEKRSALGSVYRFYFLKGALGTRNIIFSDGVSFPLLAIDWRGKQSFACTYRTLEAPTYYVNGVNQGVGAPGVITITPAAYQINIGSLYTGAAESCISPILCALQFAEVLSGEAIADLHTLMQRVKIPASSQKIHTISANLRPAGIECTEMFTGQIGSDGKFAGKMGVSVGTIVGGVVQQMVRGHLDSAMVGRAGTNYVDLTNPSSLLSADNGAIEMISTPKSVGVVAYQFVSNLNTTTQFYQNASGALISQIGNPISTLIGPNNLSRASVPMHIVMAWWLDGGVRTCELLVNGVSAGTVVFTAGSAVTLARLLGTTALSLPTVLTKTRFYSQRITPTQAQSLYIEASRAGMVQDERFGYPVSLANVTAGKVGPWNRGSGTWQWQDDGTQRKLVCAGNGYAWRGGFGDGSAFGAWYFKCKKSLDGNAVHVPFVASDKVAYSTATQNGYDFAIGSTEFLAIYRVAAGALVAVPVVSAASYVAIDTEYEFFITRRYDGLFTLYIRGGAYATWTTVGSGTDATHTTSNYVVADIDTGDTLSELMYIPMGGALLPTDVPGLED